MTMVGTFLSTRKGFPKDLKVPGEIFDSTLYYEEGGALNLAQYSVKSKSKGKVCFQRQAYIIIDVKQLYSNTDPDKIVL